MLAAEGYTRFKTKQTDFQRNPFLFSAVLVKNESSWGRV